MEPLIHVTLLPDPFILLKMQQVMATDSTASTVATRNPIPIPIPIPTPKLSVPAWWCDELQITLKG